MIWPQSNILPSSGQQEVEKCVCSPAYIAVCKVMIFCELLGRKVGQFKPLFDVTNFVEPVDDGFPKPMYLFMLVYTMSLTSVIDGSQCDLCSGELVKYTNGAICTCQPWEKKSTPKFQMIQ